MKNKAFTMAEALIALALVAVLAALSVVAISNSKPDESIVKFRKGYATTVRVVNELLNDEELYPNAKEPYDSTTSTLGDSGSIKGLRDETVTDEMRTKYPCLNDADDYGVMKFPNLFAYKVNAIDSTRTAANVKTFTTPDGINWEVIRERNNNGQEGVVIFSTRGTSTFDGCIYNANTCKVPTQFRFRIYKDGRIESLDNDPMACSYLRYPKINKAKKIPTINNSCFDNGGGGSSSGSSGGSTSSSSSSSGGSTSSSSGGSTSSSSGGSTSSSSGGSTSSSSGGSTSSSSGGSTSSSSGGSTSSSSGGSTSSSSGGSGGGTPAAAANGSGGAYQGSPLLISIDTFLENSYLDKTGTKVLTSFYEKHPELKDFNLVEPMKLFNDRVITYFIALHPEMKKELTIDTNKFISDPKLADFKALAEIYFPAFVFAYYEPDFRTKEIDGYSYESEWVQQNITNSLIKTMEQVQAAGGIFKTPSEEELKKWLIDKLLEGLW